MTFMGAKVVGEYTTEKFTIEIITLLKLRVNSEIQCSYRLVFLHSRRSSMHFSEVDASVHPCLAEKRVKLIILLSEIYFSLQRSC